VTCAIGERVTQEGGSLAFTRQAHAGPAPAAADWSGVPFRGDTRGFDSHHPLHLLRQFRQGPANTNGSVPGHFGRARYVGLSPL